jgi:hypothetical protein
VISHSDVQECYILPNPTWARLPTATHLSPFQATGVRWNIPTAYGATKTELASDGCAACH